MRPLDGVLLKLRKQLVQPFAVLGRDGNDGVKIIRCGVERDDLQKAGLVHGVDLIDEQYRRSAALAQALDERFLLRSDCRHRLNHQQHRVHIRDTLAHDLNHVVAKAGARLMEARSVHQDKLRIPAVHDRGYAVAGGLRLVGNYGYLFADECVRKRGFADVRAAAYRYHCRFGHYSSPIINFSLARI